MNTGRTPLRAGSGAMFPLSCVHVRTHTGTNKMLHTGL